MKLGHPDEKVNGIENAIGLNVFLEINGLVTLAQPNLAIERQKQHYFLLCIWRVTLRKFSIKLS